MNTLILAGCVVAWAALTVVIVRFLRYSGQISRALDDTELTDENLAAIYEAWRQ